MWVSSSGIRRVEFGPLPEDRHNEPRELWPERLAATVEQIEQYLSRSRRAFQVELDLVGVTDFQRTVYAQLLTVEFGHLVTYGDLAEMIGRPNLARAVGQAVGANPVPIVIPCHRVIAANGKLGGFSGGLPAKVGLLRLEGIEVDGEAPTSKVHPEVLRLDI